MIKNLSRILPQIVAMLFLAGFAAWAWTEPSMRRRMGMLTRR